MGGCDGGKCGARRGRWTNRNFLIDFYGKLLTGERGNGKVVVQGDFGVVGC